MGASGSAWIKPKKRTGLKPESLKDVPHPGFLRPGQRYFPLDAANKRKTTVRITRVLAGSDRCEGRREDTGGGAVRMSVSRLLARDSAGEGRYYRFVGYVSRVGYATHAVVIDASGSWLRLICPEWHPAVPITVARGAVPAKLHAPGSWVACRGDLGAPSAARIGLGFFRSPARGFDPLRYPPPAPPAAAGAERAPVAREVGERCGDIVLFLADVGASPDAGDVEIYITGHVPPVDKGARVYLHQDGEVRARRTLRRKRPSPSGTVLVLSGPAEPVVVPVAVARPSAAVSGGRHGHQSWAWRSWRRADERTA